MTERPNDAPGDDLEAAALEPAEVAEEASDLTDAEIAAATEDAELEVVGDNDDAEAVLEDEEAEDEEAAEQAEEAGEELATAAPAAPPLGARARAEQARARAAEAHIAKGPRSTRTPFPIDPSLRIKDPASTVFVAGTILVFVLIFLKAMAFGHGGAFTPTHRPATPVPTVSAAPSGSPGASGSAAPSSSPAATRASTPGGTPAPSATP